MAARRKTTPKPKPEMEPVAAITPADLATDGMPVWADGLSKRQWVAAHPEAFGNQSEGE